MRRAQEAVGTYVSTTGLEGVRHTKSAVNVLCEDVAREAVYGIVRELDDFLLALELDDHRDGPEDLLPDDLHVWLNVREDCWLNEVTRVTRLSAADLERRPLLLAGLDIA